ncbi:MAG TPA: helix-turn-helix domain-containing protein [Solirubrobacteraceae bacterium]|nr:helix-turn-helix domain-containing protein [Solirubrobacteraceae bacterium]
MTAVEERPRRADALRNRARVVAAATELFAARGLEVSVPEIAARAGVGKATVYRSFPTKEHLVAAVVVERLATFEADIRAALVADEAWPALVEVLCRQSEVLAADRALAGGLTQQIHLPALEAARASMWEALDALLARAREEGGMRADITAGDLRVLWAGMCRVLVGEEESDPAVWRRYAALVAAAMRADGTPAPSSA